MISETANLGESQFSSQPRLSSGIRGHVLAHQPPCSELQSSLRPSHMCQTPGKSQIPTHSKEKKKKKSPSCSRGCGMQSRHPQHLKFTSRQSQWERCWWGARSRSLCCAENRCLRAHPALRNWLILLARGMNAASDLIAFTVLSQLLNPISDCQLLVGSCVQRNGSTLRGEGAYRLAKQKLC